MKFLRNSLFCFLAMIGAQSVATAGNSDHYNAAYDAIVIPTDDTLDELVQSIIKTPAFAHGQSDAMNDLYKKYIKQTLTSDAFRVELATIYMSLFSLEELTALNESLAQPEIQTFHERLMLVTLNGLQAFQFASTSFQDDFRAEYDEVQRVEFEEYLSSEKLLKDHNSTTQDNPAMDVEQLIAQMKNTNKSPETDDYEPSTYAEAAAYYETGVENFDVDKMNDYAYLLATSANDEYRDPARAVELMEQVLASQEYEFYHKDTYASALAAIGEFEKAAEMQKEAILDMPDDIRYTRKKSYLKRLAAYRKGEQWYNEFYAE